MSMCRESGGEDPIMRRQSSWETVHWLYLTAVHDFTETADTNGVEPARVLKALSLEEDEAEAVLDFLVRAGVIVWPAKGEILMTELGVTMVEQMRQTADETSEESEWVLTKATYK
jgi:predicted transcriptional regulator